jgi:hypothetical protein
MSRKVQVVFAVLLAALLIVSSVSYFQNQTHGYASSPQRLIVQIHPSRDLSQGLGVNQSVILSGICLNASYEHFNYEWTMNGSIVGTEQNFTLSFPNAISGTLVSFSVTGRNNAQGFASLWVADPASLPDVYQDSLPFGYVLSYDGLGWYYYTVNGQLTYQDTNETLVEQFVIGNLTVAGGKYQLQAVQHNQSLALPSNVMYVQDYQGARTYNGTLTTSLLSVSGTGTFGNVTTTDPQNGYSYLIYFDSSHVYHAKAANGTVCWSNSTDAGNLFNHVISAIGETDNPAKSIQANGGGTIQVVSGNYTFKSKIFIANMSRISIIAQSGTWFIGDILPIFEFGGNGMDMWGHNGLGGTAPVGYDFHLQGINFLYNGTVQNGVFVYIHEIENTIAPWLGGCDLTNVNIYSTDNPTFTIGAITNDNFIGLECEDVMGFDFNHLSIADFGVGYDYNTTMWGANHNTFNDLCISYCDVCSYYPQSDLTTEQINGAQFMTFSKYGFYVNTYGNMLNVNGVTQQDNGYGFTINNYLAESFSGTAGWFNSTAVTIDTGDIINARSYSNTVGFVTPINKGNSLTVRNVNFWNVSNPLNTGCLTYLWENTYVLATTPLIQNGSYSETYGTDPAIIPNTIIPIACPTALAGSIGWSQTNNGGGGNFLSNTQFGTYTGAPAGSYGLLYAYALGLNNGSAYYQYVDFSRYIEWSFTIMRGGDYDAGGTFAAHVQLKNANTEGNLTGIGVGIDVFGNALWCSAYGSNLGKLGLAGMSMSQYYNVDIKMYAGAEIDFYVGGVLCGTLTGTDVPTGITSNPCYIVVSSNNGVTTLNNEFHVTNMQFTIGQP